MSNRTRLKPKVSYTENVSYRGQGPVDYKCHNIGGEWWALIGTEETTERLG